MQTLSTESGTALTLNTEPSYVTIGTERSEGVIAASYFNGTIDDVHIYNRALSASQILALFNNRTDLIVSSETQLHDVWHAVVVPNDGFGDGPPARSNNLTIITPAIQYPTKTGFGRRTTNFDNENDLNTVDKVILENESFGEIAWLSNDLNVTAANFTQHIRMVAGSVSVNSSALSSTLNSSANITLYKLRFNQTPVVLADGIVCVNCTVISYTVDNNLTFNVTHFTNYSAAANSNLTIFDLNDTDIKALPTYKNFIQFYANYSNRTSGAAINISEGGLCNVSFNVTPAGPFNMTFNSSSQLY